jgi:hypothetical protein
MQRNVDAETELLYPALAQTVLNNEKAAVYSLYRMLQQIDSNAQSVQRRYLRLHQPSIVFKFLIDTGRCGCAVHYSTVQYMHCWCCLMAAKNQLADRYGSLNLQPYRASNVSDSFNPFK